jgi:hypothetical protein
LGLANPNDPLACGSRKHMHQFIPYAGHCHGKLMEVRQFHTEKQDRFWF